MLTLTHPASIARAMTPQLRAVMHAQPLINSKRQHGGMRVVIDNRSCGEDDVRAALELVSELNAGAALPLVVAFADPDMPISLAGWQPPPNTFPEFHGEWVRITPIRQLLARGHFPAWCLNGTPGRTLEPVLADSLAYTISGGVPGSTADHSPLPGKPKIRTGVHTHAEADVLFAKGFQFVAGWPLVAPPPQGKFRRAGSRMVAMRLLQMVQADADVDDLEDMFERDFGLAFKLLRFINSAANGLSIQVESLQQAVLLLGYARLKRWLALLVLASSEDPNQLPLMGFSLRRAFFIERLHWLQTHAVDADEPFMTGLFSLLDRIFAQPFEELLSQMRLPDAVTQSLSGGDGPYGPLLRLAAAVEADDTVAIHACAAALHLDDADVNRALLQSIRDADRVELG